jgi:hypothetical protein
MQMVSISRFAQLISKEVRRLVMSLSEFLRYDSTSPFGPFPGEAV